MLLLYNRFTIYISGDNMQKPKKMKYRLGLLVIISIIALIVAFSVYMMSTSLEEVLYDERGVQVITHDDKK